MDRFRDENKAWNSTAASYRAAPMRHVRRYAECGIIRIGSSRRDGSIFGRWSCGIIRNQKSHPDGCIQSFSDAVQYLVSTCVVPTNVRPAEPGVSPRALSTGKIAASDISRRPTTEQPISWVRLMNDAALFLARGMSSSDDHARSGVSGSGS